MKLFLGIPTAGDPTGPFLESLGRLIVPPEISIEHKTVTGNFVPAQRELLVQFAQDAQADFLLMVDDDIVVPPEAVRKLLDAFDHDTAVVGGLYYSRDGLRPMGADGWNRNHAPRAHIPAFDDTTAREVSGIGCGCMMVRMSCFAALRRPYFNAQIFIEKARAQVRLCNEDYLLCEAFRDAGYRIKMHGGVRCLHFDRVSNQLFPLAQENNTETDHPRMTVLRDGRFQLVPDDSSVPGASERFEVATLDYVFTD